MLRNVTGLIPLWLEGSINLVCSMAAVALRKKYGRHLRVTGGFSRCVLAQGKTATDTELARVMLLIDQGC